MAKTVSIKKIAEECGVSVATVSRILNKNGRYSAETEKRVLKAVRDNHYVPNMVAKGLRVQRIMNVGVIVPDITNEYFGKMVHEIGNDLFDQGYQMFLCNTNENADREEQCVRLMAMQNVCGLICLSNGVQTDEEAVKNAGIPTVFVDREPKKFHDGYSYVCSDNEAGGFMATKELLDQGCRKILFMTCAGDVPGYQERYEGYVRALSEAGLGQESIRKVSLRSTHYREAHDVMMGLLDNGDFPYDGIFAASDWLAVGCFRALQEHGIDVPGKVKLVGFDDISITAFTSVPITSVHQQIDKIALLATQELLRLVSDQESGAVSTIHVPVYLVPRASTRGEKAEKYI